MESLGKEKDLSGRIVEQGIAVYGNKGSTDQHAYVQQLRDGINNFFVTFIEVLKERNGEAVQVEPEITSGDYLEGFFLGTREALAEKNRQSLTLTINEVSAYTVGQLIALYERAVGLYANLIGINAYHQPGVEAGKKAASSTLDLQKRVVRLLKESHQPLTAEAIARELNETGRVEVIFKLLEYLSANPTKRISKTANPVFYHNLYGYIA